MVGLAAVAAAATGLLTPASPASSRLFSIVGRPLPVVGAPRRWAGLSSSSASSMFSVFSMTGILVGVALLFGLKSAVVTALLGSVGALAARRARARRRAQSLRAGVVELARAVAGELRSGRGASAALRAGIESAGESCQLLLAPAAELSSRGDLIDVCDALDAVISAASPSVSGSLEGLHRLAVCLRVAASSGATLAPTVDRVADALQDEIELDRFLAGALAAPRATVRLLAALPFLGALLGAAIGADPLRFLLGSRPGLACAAIAMCFDLAGVAWAHRIARRAAAIG